jgi:hypothetical protein
MNNNANVHINGAAAAAVAATAAAGLLRALLSWFPVHPTSMNNTNTLLSGDNKGAAEQFVEKRWAPQQQGLEPGFMAAFVQSNGADTSPNILGTYCLDTGEQTYQRVLSANVFICGVKPIT